MPVAVPDETARAVLAGLRLAGKVHDAGPLCFVEGEVSWLDLLFCDLAQLAPYGFRFRQEYHYAPGSHRVVARNRLVTQSAIWSAPGFPPGCLPQSNT